VADEMVNAGVGLSCIEAACAGAPNPGFNYPSDFLGQYNTMNTVSIQDLAVDWGSLTYVVAL
jgi:hypothetical protein